MEKRELRFRQDGTFKVMQLTDIHYTDDDETDHDSVRQIREWIAAEKPDLVMVTGDAVYGTDNLKNIGKAMAPLIEAGVPWSFVFGNHDVEHHSSRKELFGILEEMPGFVGYHDPAAKDGYGNHMLPIRGREGKVRWVIAGIDSGNRNPLQAVGGYQYVSRRQIAWYENRIRDLEKESEAFSVLAFQHMAVPEIQDVWRYEKCYGVKRDGFGCPLVNSGQFLAALEDGHTKGMFFGHDHVNSFWGKLYGITLGYGRISGRGGYGAEDYPRGARLFVLKEDRLDDFDTYEILDNGNYVRDPWGQEPRAIRDEG